MKRWWQKPDFKCKPEYEWILGGCTAGLGFVMDVHYYPFAPFWYFMLGGFLMGHALSRTKFK